MRHTFFLMNAVYFQSIFWSEKFMIVGGCESTFYQKVESFILFLFCPPSSCFCPQTWPNVPKRVKIFFHLRFIVGAQARKYLDRSKGYTIH